jgi:hypothetical protein
LTLITFACTRLRVWLTVMISELQQVVSSLFTSAFVRTRIRLLLLDCFKVIGDACRTCDNALFNRLSPYHFPSSLHFLFHLFYAQ